MKHTSKRMLSLLVVLALVLGMFSTSALAAAQYNPGQDTEIVNLRVDEQAEPINVEPSATAPLNFSWEMASNVLGQAQAAYQIVVTDEAGAVVWNSGKVVSNESVDVEYEGQALTPDTRYTWEVTVWDVYGSAYAASSVFETSLLSQDQAAWNGAEFIGVEKLVLDADSLYTYYVGTDFQIVAGSSASVVFAANDFRMNNPYQNKWQIDGSEGNYVRVEVDISELADGIEGGSAKLNLYAPGYDNSYEEDVPFKTVAISTNVINAENMHEKHSVLIYETIGRVTVSVDGVQLFRDKISSNFYTSHNNNVFPQLNDVGFAARKGEEVVFSNYYITNSQRQGGNMTLLSDTVGATYAIFDEGNYNTYVQDGGSMYVSEDGARIIVKGGEAEAVATQKQPLSLVAYTDPSYYGNTMLRKEFTVNRDLADAKLFVTAMGTFELEINGEAVAPENFFEPGFSMYRESLYYTAYDVSDFVKQGENAIGATLGAGWYTGYMTYSTEQNFNLWGDYEALLAMLVLTYADGTKEYVVTDTSWEGFKDGPVRYGNFYQGSTYDASKEAAVEGYSTVGYDASAWTEEVTVIGLRDWMTTGGSNWGLYARQDAPVHLHEVLTANRVVAEADPASGTFTYDMGVNMVGVPQVTFPTANMQPGDKVVFRFAEHLFPGLESEINYNYSFEKTYNPDGSRNPNGDEYTKTVTWADIYGDNAIEDEAARNGGIAGRIMTDTYRAAYATDTYIVSAEDIAAGSVTYAPSFTARGYQYVQITVPGTTEALPLENVKGLVLTSSEAIRGTYDATAPETTTDAWGNETTLGDLADQLYKNISRSQLGNFFSLPTDCPQRNERMGWTGDAQAYSLMSTYVSDTTNFWSTWMQSLRDSQSTTGGIDSTCPNYNTTRPTNMPNGTTWAAAVCMVPWNVYSQYGDTTIITEYADVMFKWLDGMAGNRLTAAMAADDMTAYLQANTDQYSFSNTYKNLRSSSVTSGLCDWLARDSANSTVVNNSIYLYMVELTSIMFEEVGDARADVLKAYHELIKDEWNLAFVDPETGLTKSWSGGGGSGFGSSGGSTEGTFGVDDSQTSYASPLNYNTFSDQYTVTVNGETYTYKEFAAMRLAQLVANPDLSGSGNLEAGGGSGLGGDSSTVYPPYTITTGFSGTANILDALSANGYNDEAYKLFLSTEYASWLYPVSMGATTVYERWNSYQLAFENGIDSSNSMNSFNHFALGAAGSWMFEYQLGISNNTRAEDSSFIGKGGYQDFVLQPMPGAGYTALEGSYVSSYGVIESAWTAEDSAMTSYSTAVPANTTATLYLPVGDKAVNVPDELAAFVTVKGAAERYGKVCTVLELKAGAYDFAIGETVDVSVRDGYVVPDVEAGTGVTLNLTGAAEVTVDVDELSYTLSATDAIDLATATLTFAVSGLVNPVVEGENGWYVISQAYADGVLTAVVANNKSTSGAAELVTLTGETTGKTGTVSVELTDAVLSAYVGSSEAFVAAVLGDVAVETAVKYSVYDVNQDGVVDQLDITRAQRAYGASVGDQNWNALADVNGDKTVDINDLILILNNYTK